MLLIDCHSDIAIDVLRRRLAGERAVIARRHLPRLREGSVGAAVCTVGGDSPGLLPFGRTRAYEGTLALLGALERDVAEADGAIALVGSAAGVREAYEAGVFAIVPALEGAEPLEGRLERLDELRERGVRSVGLTWNSSNELATGHGAGAGGLTALGERALERMRELGIVVDLAHAAPRTFWDVVHAGDGPLMVSHANAAALHPHERNLDDAQLDAVAACDGLVCVAAFPAFVGAGAPTLDDVVEHIAYMVQRLGGRHVGIGADFVDYLDEYDIAFPAGIPDCRALGRLPSALSARGAAPRDVAGVAAESFLRVLAAVDPRA